MENCHEAPHFPCRMPCAASHSILGGVLVHFQVFKGQKCYEMFMTCVFPICSLYQVLNHDSSIKSRPSCHVASFKTHICYIYIIYIYISVGLTSRGPRPSFCSCRDILLPGTRSVKITGGTSIPDPKPSIFSGFDQF